jgi:anti-sigma factor RsiW
MITLPPSDYVLNAYVDHKLDDVDRVTLQTWLGAHPDVAEQIRRWQKDAHFLRAAFSGLLPRDASAQLDPALIRQGLRHNRYRHYATAAVLLVAVSVGGLTGWHARDLSMDNSILPMADAMQAYRMFALNDQLPSDWSAQKPGDAQQWLDRNFASAHRLPDMGSAGFKPVSARLTSTEQGAAAMVVYKDEQGHALSFYIRPPGEHIRLLPRGSRQDGDLQADYWSGGDYNYAVVGPAKDEAVQRARRTLTDGI